MQKASTTDSDLAHLDMTPVGNTLDPQSHVMISYQWADQETVKKIRDQLRSHVSVVCHGDQIHY